MKTKVNLNLMKDIMAFLQDVKTLEGDIVATQGQAKIDCKSILGLLSLNLSKPIDVEYEGDNENAFSDIITKYID